MAVNADLLVETLVHIEAHPEEWNQRSWRCGTGMCFAGWAATLSGREWAYEIDAWKDKARELVSFTNALLKPAPNERNVRHVIGRFTAEGMYVENVAKNLLGLTDQKASLLFNANNDLDDLRLIVKGYINGDNVTKVENDRDADRERRRQEIEVSNELL